ncbi:MAG: magnesium/cobalt transporter CorA [Dysgonamonadaceae bacterium]|jgi:magnesium transporter|nr:magnesium/cobalt transporter CorA [Dysgonamonadaceae bacterium]MDD3308655.1 magnesium/cobalt transporter CorA [Dysgonamonadaceae bacterium]MDD3899753.1 magnesium/cobalt transporter CorA [Dysgonamonadaceae bacterium]MDD4397968.1 magnesium/cobalt transporter CorA [Dysgonamonadaceae bacterium]MEA5080205.1 magnesium/cobalt transporter CorA [Dysgonamonadaceae bacterium]
MSTTYAKKKEDIGLSPFEIKFRGQKKSDKVLMTIFEMTAENVIERNVHTIEEIQNHLNSDSLIWLNIDGLHNEKLMSEISSFFSIPSNILSDIMDPSIRSQVEEFDDGIFTSVKMLEFDEKAEKVSVDNLSLIVMKRIIISFQEESGDVFNPVRERIRKHKNKIRTSGTDYLAFALLDIVIDNYIYILGAYGEKVETLEDRLALAPNKEILNIINLLKHELNRLRRSIRPTKEMIMSLVKLDSDLIQDVNRTYFKELQDNILQATEMLDYYREVLYDELDIYHSSMSTKLNDIMALLTIFSGIFIPLTFIVGVYGTNFDILPELHWKYGYFIMWGIMIVIAVFMIWYFKKRKWF